MPDVPTFALFVAAALALLLVPGPAVIYVVARSVEGGRLTGLVSVLGVELGTLLHVVFAAAGLSAIVVSSAVAFSVVKWLGAAYLVWFGLRQILGRDGGDQEAPPSGSGENRLRVFSQSVLVQVLNLKVALFFLAFLPQFVDPSRSAAWTQVVVLGTTLATLGLFTDGLYALLGGTAGEWIRKQRAGAGLRRARRFVTGGVYIALGAVAAISGKDEEEGMDFGVTLQTNPPASRVIELTRRAEELGFGYAWTFDSHILWQEPYVIHSQMLSATERIMVGPFVTNPVSRDPSVTASTFATLNDTFGNRTICGIGRGDSVVRVLGRKPTTLRQLEEAMHVIKELAEGREVDYSGVKVRIPWV